MGNVVQLNFPTRQTITSRQAELLACFANHRRGGDDVFWLKENAELLNIFQATGATLESDALEPFAAFYEQIEKRLRFFPQYYRFLLAMCLDLEDLGMPGNKGAALCKWAASAGLAGAELSDLQRAEARRLMARRGVEALPLDRGLTSRLHQFIDRSVTFAMPNKKAAYELTHIVFYLSEYGRKDPGLSTDAIVSLEFAGLLAYLDQNIDLLAEICVALRHAGQTPSQLWEQAVTGALSGFEMVPNDSATRQDDYHEYIVAAWADVTAGGTGFDKDLVAGPLAIMRTRGVRHAPLRAMSECMFELDDARSADWARMRPLVARNLPEDCYEILTSAEQSTDKFDAFFEGFARAVASA